jgi:hypothetical protein
MKFFATSAARPLNHESWLLSNYRLSCRHSLFKKRIVHITRPQPLLRFATRFLDKRFSITQRTEMANIALVITLAAALTCG